MYEHLAREIRVDLALLSDQPLGPSVSGCFSWSRDGEMHIEMDFRISVDGKRIHFREVGDPRKHVWIINFDFTRQHFGGWRRWFVCPACKRRCRVLYFYDIFLCRPCAGITYFSKDLPFRTGQIASAKRKRLHLSGAQDLSAPFPPKPRNMHWKTYKALEQADLTAQIRLDRIMGMALRN